MARKFVNHTQASLDGNDPHPGQSSAQAVDALEKQERAGEGGGGLVEYGGHGLGLGETISVLASNRSSFGFGAKEREREGEGATSWRLGNATDGLDGGRAVDERAKTRFARDGGDASRLDHGAPSRHLSAYSRFYLACATPRGHLVAPSIPSMSQNIQCMEC